MADLVAGSLIYNFDVQGEEKLDAALANAKAETESFGSSLGNVSFQNFSSDASQAFGNIADGIQSVITKAALLTIGGGALGSIFLNSAAGLQQTNIGFQSLIGNTQEANKLFGQLVQYANVTPFQAQDVTKAAQTLLGFGTSSQQTYDWIKKLGDISSATGGHITDLSLVTGQIFAQGKLRAQDMYQVINDGGGALVRIMAANAGGMQKLTDEFQKGGIPAQAYFDAVNQATAQGGFAFQGAQRQADTFNGRLSTLKDAVLTFGRSLLGVTIDAQGGFNIQPGGLFDTLTNSIPGIIANLQNLTPVVTNAFDFLVKNGQTIGDIILGIGAAFVVARAAAIGFGIASALANPFQATALAITLVVGILTTLQAKFGIFNGVAKTASDIFNGLVNGFRQGNPLIQGLVIFIGALAAGFAIYGIAIGAVTLATIVWGAATTAAGVALAFVTSPIFLVIAAVAALAAIVFLVITNWSSITKFFSDVWASISKTVGDGVKDVVNFFGGIKDKILGVLGDAGTWLLDVGKNIIQGLINGVTSMANNAANAVKNVGSGAVDGFKKLLGIHSPSTVFAGIGQNIGEGLINGINQTQGQVQDAINGLGGTVNIDSSFATSTLAPSTQQLATSSVAGNAVQPGASININLELKGIYARSQSDLREVGKQMIGAVNQELRARRLPEIGNGALAA